MAEEVVWAGLSGEMVTHPFYVPSGRPRSVLRPTPLCPGGWSGPVPGRLAEHPEEVDQENGDGDGGGPDCEDGVGAQ